MANKYCVHARDMEGSAQRGLSGGSKSEPLLQTKYIWCSISKCLWVLVKMAWVVVKESWVVAEADHHRPVWAEPWMWVHNVWARCGWGVRVGGEGWGMRGEGGECMGVGYMCVHPSQLLIPYPWPQWPTYSRRGDLHNQRFHVVLEDLQHRVAARAPPTMSCDKRSIVMWLTTLSTACKYAQ